MKKLPGKKKPPTNMLKAAVKPAAQSVASNEKEVVMKKLPDKRKLPTLT